MLVYPFKEPKMPHFRWIPFLLIIGISFSCAGKISSKSPLTPETAPIPWPDARFMVLSDTHVYSRELGVSGAAFEEYLLHDRKLLVESVEVLEEAVKRVAASRPDFLIVCGDLTKDGEKLNHELLASKWRALEQAGTPVFVVPGNHDIDNPHAQRFAETKSEPVERVSASEFAQIYAQFGYGEALDRDPDSLSWVAEPAPGLWLVGVDSAQYESNLADGRPKTAGKIREATIRWLSAVFAKASQARKALVVLHHHGLLEHYRGERRFNSQYLIEDGERLAEFYSENGVRLVFTGHHHAQDIALKTWNDGRWLYDVETGSLVTPPFPLRTVVFEKGSATIHSEFIDEIPSYRDRGLRFQEAGARTIRQGIESLIERTMVSVLVDTKEAAILSRQVAASLMAHYYGDEEFLGSEKLKTQGLGLVASLLVAYGRDLVDGFWEDPAPPDNNITIGPDGRFTK